MSVSYALCEQYLPLVITALESEPSSRVRSSLIIGLGDLAFRFPNAVEPWTAHLYARYITILIISTSIDNQHQ